jgi:transcription elongation factor GreA-like protein
LIINRASFYAVIVRNELMMIQDVWEKLIRIVGKHDKNIPILESETLLFVHEP